jgi:hypothetical protein
MTLITGIIEKGVHSQSRVCLLLSIVVICINSLRQFFVKTGLTRFAWSEGDDFY